MKAQFFVTLALIFFANFLSSQTSHPPQSNSVTIKEPTLEEKMEGTYQIIITDNKIAEAFTTDILPIIESKRQDTEDVYYEISKYTTIRIYSRAKINSPEFKTKKK